jgi:hypothetical protein
MEPGGSCKNAMTRRTELFRLNGACTQTSGRLVRYSFREFFHKGVSFGGLARVEIRIDNPIRQLTISPLYRRSV